MIFMCSLSRHWSKLKSFSSRIGSIRSIIGQQAKKPFTLQYSSHSMFLYHKLCIKTIFTLTKKNVTKNNFFSSLHEFFSSIEKRNIKKVSIKKLSGIVMQLLYWVLVSFFTFFFCIENYDANYFLYKKIIIKMYE